VFIKELEKLIHFQHIEIPKNGYYAALEANPAKTLIIQGLFLISPRSTYLSIYYLDPDLLSMILKADYSKFSHMMILFPEFVVSYHLLYNYYYDHPLTTIEFCYTLVLSIILTIFNFTKKENVNVNAVNGCLFFYNILVPLYFTAFHSNKYVRYGFMIVRLFYSLFITFCLFAYLFFSNEGSNRGITKKGTRRYHMD
jgi:hypothetical protein